MKIYLGIDPGTFKTGWAFVSREGELLLSGIVPWDDFEIFLTKISNSDWEYLDNYIIEGSPHNLPALLEIVVILGGGTSSGLYLDVLGKKGYQPVVASEHGTTLGARSLYWEIHPPEGLRRFLPLSLQVPPRDIDDLAAWKIVLNSIE